VCLRFRASLAKREGSIIGRAIIGRAVRSKHLQQSPPTGEAGKG
jgi:hypothetical protein